MPLPVGCDLALLALLDSDLVFLVGVGRFCNRSAVGRFSWVGLPVGVVATAAGLDDWHISQTVARGLRLRNVHAMHCQPCAVPTPAAGATLPAMPVDGRSSDEGGDKDGDGAMGVRVEERTARLPVSPSPRSTAAAAVASTTGAAGLAAASAAAAAAVRAPSPAAGCAAAAPTSDPLVA